MKLRRGYIKDDKHFVKLDETRVLLLGHVFDEVYAVNKITKEELGIFQFDNDPTCGLIGNNNDWCLVGGNILVLKTWFDKTLRPVGDLQHIHQLRLLNAYSALILTDPWAEQASIWQLDIDPKMLASPVSLIKVKDFIEYKDKPYTKDVKW